MFRLTNYQLLPIISRILDGAPSGRLLITYMSNRIVTFLKESKQELKRVNWPTKDETKRYTIFVILFSLVFALFLGLLDHGFLRALEFAVQ